MKYRNVSRKKRRKKKYRQGSCKNWIRNYAGENIVLGYAKWYGVDLICAIKELRMNGIYVDEEYEKEIKESIEEKKRVRVLNAENRKRKKKEREEEFVDERFAFIVGYTSGGAAYGVTHEEMKSYQEEEIEDQDEDQDQDEDEIEFDEIFNS